MREMPQDMFHVLIGANFFIENGFAHDGRWKKTRKEGREQALAGINFFGTMTSLELVSRNRGQRRLDYCTLSVEDLLRLGRQALAEGYVCPNR